MTDVLNAPCAECARETLHDVLHTKAKDTGRGMPKTFDMLQCRGCRSVSLRESSDWGLGKGKVSVRYYPAPGRKLPEWAMIMDIDFKGAETFGGLLREVYDAVRNGLNQLA